MYRFVSSEVAARERCERVGIGGQRSGWRQDMDIKGIILKSEIVKYIFSTAII